MLQSNPILRLFTNFKGNWNLFRSNNFFFGLMWANIIKQCHFKQQLPNKIKNILNIISILGVMHIDLIETQFEGKILFTHIILTNQFYKF